MLARLAFGLALGLGRAAAQDVSVGVPASLRPMQSVDKLPTTFARLRPSFPPGMRAFDEPGYVIAIRYVDGRRQAIEQSIHGTHPLFEQSVKDAARRWVFSQPAMRGREKIPAHVWVPVIFNPKSAGEKARDASPRLLAVEPVFVASAAGGASEPFVVRVQLELDAAGAIVALAPATPLDEALERAVRASLQKWRFAPARGGGRAIAAKLTLSVLCEPVSGDYFRRVPPKLLAKSWRGYPPELDGSGMEADVVLGFDIDANGAVKNPVVVASTNPLFDATAVAALHEWKYEPATLDGRPTATEGMRTTFHYYTHGVGRDGFEVRDTYDAAKLPPALHYDTPAKLRGGLAPVYPYALRSAGVTGRAKVVAAIDTHGHVSGVKVLSADKPEFGRALAAALEGFVFDPALKEGKPVPSLFTLEKKFERDPQPFDPSSRLLAREKNHPEQIVAPDEPLVPVSQRPAVFPVSLPKDVHSGTARIEVLVDEEGFARLPRIVAATDEAFGYAAAQAVSAWQFERPRKNGKPAVVRAEIPFSFTAAATARAGAPAK